MRAGFAWGGCFAGGSSWGLMGIQTFPGPTLPGCRSCVVLSVARLVLATLRWFVRAVTNMRMADRPGLFVGARCRLSPTRPRLLSGGQVMGCRFSCG